MTASNLFAFALLVLPCALVLAALAIALWARRRRRRWRTTWDPSTHKRDEVDAREWRKLYEQQPAPEPEPESARLHRSYVSEYPGPATDRDVRRPRVVPLEVHGRDWTDTGGFSFAYGSDGWILLQHLRTAGLRNRMVVQATKVGLYRPGVIEIEVKVATSSSTYTAFSMRVPVDDIPAMLRAVDEAVDGFAQRKQASSATKAIEGPKA